MELFVDIAARAILLLVFIAFIVWNSREFMKQGRHWLTSVLYFAAVLIGTIGVLASLLKPWS